MFNSPKEYRQLGTDILYFGVEYKLFETGKWEDVESTLTGLFSKKYEVKSYIDPYGNVYTEKVPIENNLDDLNGKVLEASKNSGGSAEKLTEKQIKNEFGNVNTFHRDVKPNILKDAKQLDPKISKGKDTNFDILIDAEGKISLQGNSTKKIYETSLNIEWYK